MHHGGPFDRFLIAQAQAKGLVLVTRDARIPRYGVPHAGSVGKSQFRSTAGHIL